LDKIEKEALVDTGALMLCIPEHIRVQMGFDELEKREITTADGKKQLVPYVGPVLLQFENRNCFVGALVLGDEILLGAVPMEDMDLVISPALKKVMINPDSPNYPQALVK
jgi:clan AA aspartic protease